MDSKFMRTLIESFYDAQKLRIGIGNRLVANTMAKLGLEPGEKKENMEDDAAKVLKELTMWYTRITDGLANVPARKRIAEIEKADGLIADVFEYNAVGIYHDMLGKEKSMEKNIGKALEVFPIYTEFLKGVKGCGPLMSGVILSYMDIHKARHISSFWKLSGLDTVTIVDEATGETRVEGRRNFGAHLVDREYIAKDGTTQTKKSITYRPFLKTKLLGVLGSSFLKCNSPYRVYYDNYKHREVS